MSARVATPPTFCEKCGQRQYLVTSSHICGNCAWDYEMKAQKFLKDRA